MKLKIDDATLIYVCISVMVNKAICRIVCRFHYLTRIMQLQHTLEQQNSF